MSLSPEELSHLKEENERLEINDTMKSNTIQGLREQLCDIQKIQKGLLEKIYDLKFHAR